MKLRRVLQIIVISGLLALLWILVDPALAVVCGIISLGALRSASLGSKPQWIKIVWSWCKDAAVDKSGPWGL